MITRPVQTEAGGDRRTVGRRLTVALAAGSVPLLLAATATTASADRAIVEHWVDDYTVTHLDGSEASVATSASTWSNTAKRRASSSAHAGAATASGTSVTASPVRRRWSNPENGREFRIEFSGTNRDQLVTDNGDGTLTIQVQATGPSRAYADGALTFIDTGIVRFSILVDHAGTPTDPADDVFLAFLGVDKEAGLRQTEGRDFCADLVEFIG